VARSGAFDDGHRVGNSFEHREEAVDHSRRFLGLDRDARHRHRLGIGDPFVAERIELRHQNRRRRQARQVAVLQHRGVGMGRRHVIYVVCPVPLHHGGREEIVSPAVRDVRRTVEIGIGDGIDQKLVRQRRAGLIPCADRDGGGEVSARAISGDRQPCRIDTQVRGVIYRPQQRIVTVVERTGELGLRRKAIIDREHRCPAGTRQRPRRCVMRFEIADDPAAAVVEENQRSILSGTFGAVEPGADGPPGQVQRQIADFSNRGGWSRLHQADGFAQDLGGDGRKIDRRHLR